MGFIGKLFKLLIIVIILGVLAGVGFVLFADPNNYKEKINNILQTYTGLPLTVNGSIDWIIRPEALIKLQDVTLNAPDSDKPAIQIKDMTIKMDTAKAFKDNVVIKEVIINSPMINWQQTKAAIHGANSTGKACTIQKLALKNGTITVQELDDNIDWLLQNVSFTADSFVLNGASELPALKVEGLLTNVSNNVQYTIDTTAKFDVKGHILTLDPLKMIWNDTPMQGSAVIKQYDTDPVISGNFALAATDIGTLLSKLDPYYANSDAVINNIMQVETAYSYTPKDRVLDLTKLNLQIDKGMMSGDVKLGFTSPYNAEFNLNAENFNFVPLGMLGSALFPASHTMNTVPVDFIKQISVQGKFTGTQVNFTNTFALEQMHMEVKGTNGVVQFAPVLINAYGGTHDIALQMDVTGAQPKFALTEQATKVDLDPWLKLIGNDKVISGQTNLKASLQATGNNVVAIKQSINGGINLFVTDGLLYGVDVTSLMQFSTQTVTDIFKELTTSAGTNMNVLAIKKSSNWIQTQVDHPKTKFDNFELLVQIENGKSKQASIAMTNNAIELKGRGSFVLSDQTINFDTTIEPRNEPTDIKILAKYMAATPLSMTITGTITAPTFGPNVQAYVTNILKSGITDLQNEALKKMISATPANAKTDKTATELFLNSLQSLNK